MSPEGAEAVARILRAAGWTAADLIAHPAAAGVVAREARARGIGPALRMAVRILAVRPGRV